MNSLTSETYLVILNLNDLSGLFEWSDDAQNGPKVRCPNRLHFIRQQPTVHARVVYYGGNGWSHRGSASVRPANVLHESWQRRVCFVDSHCYLLRLVCLIFHCVCLLLVFVYVVASGKIVIKKRWVLWNELLIFVLRNQFFWKDIVRLEVKRGITIRCYVKSRYKKLAVWLTESRKQDCFTQCLLLVKWTIGIAPRLKITNVCAAILTPTMSSPCSCSPKVCSKLITCVRNLGIAFSTYSLTLNMKLTFIWFN